MYARLTLGEGSRSSHWVPSQVDRGTKLRLSATPPEARVRELFATIMTSLASSRATWRAVSNVKKPPERECDRSPAVELMLVALCETADKGSSIAAAVAAGLCSAVGEVLGLRRSKMAETMSPI